MSEAEEVGSIVAFLTLNRTEWIRGVRATQEEARKLGADSPNIKIDTNAGSIIVQLQGVRTVADTVGRQSPNVRIKSNAKEQTFEMHALRDAILLIGPAAVPIAGVAGGALLGLLPVAAAVILGIKGIAAAQKSGALQNTQYANDFKALKAELGASESSASGGLLAGLDVALSSAKPLFKEVNSDIGVMGVQLGDIVAHAAPGLLGLFTKFDPLFNTFGMNLDGGAQKLENWAQSSDGITKFVAWVQVNLPEVEHDFGQLLTAAVHLTAGLGPIGIVGLRSLGLLSTAINLIPQKNLGQIESTLISGYAAWRTYGAVSAAAANIAASSSARAASASLLAAAAAKQEQLASLEKQFAAEEEAAARAEATAIELQSYAVLVAASDNASARMIIDSQNAALAAQTAADEIALSAAVTAEALTTVAAELETTAVVASASWVAVAGPLAAVAVGVGLMTAVMGTNTDAAQKNKASIDDYTTSLQQNANALAQVNLESTNKQLQDKGDLAFVDHLAASNKHLGLTYGDVALAVNGSNDQFDAMIVKLRKIADANKAHGDQAFKPLVPGVIDPQQTSVQWYTKNGYAATKLANDIFNLRNNLTAAQKTQLEYNEALRQAQIATDGGTTAVAAHARQLGLTSDEYLVAQQAAQKNTDQTKAQTAAFQAAGDAASLLQQDLEGLAGQNLSNAQAQTNLASANLQVAASFKENGRAIDGNGAKAVANQQAIQASVQAAQQLALTLDKGSHSQRDAAKSFEASKTSLENQLRAQGKLTPAVQAYINKLYDLKDFNAYLAKHPTPVDAKTAAAHAKVAALQTQIDKLKQVKPPNVGIGELAKYQIAELQLQIDRLEGKTIPISLAISGYVKGQTKAGGQVNSNIIRQIVDGFAAGGDVNDGWFTVGEQGGRGGFELGYKSGTQVRIFSNSQSQKMVGAGSVAGLSAAKSMPMVSAPALTLPSASRSGGASSSSSSTSGASSRGGSLRVAGGTVALTVDSQGNLTAFIRDLILDEADHAATIDRMH